MRIAFVTYDFGEYSVQHANGLLDHGDVLLVLPEELLEPHREMLDDAVECFAFDKPRLRQAFRQISTARKIVAAINDFKPDVIHFQLGHMWFNFALAYLHRRFPIVFTVHDARQHVGDQGAKNTPQWIMDFGFRTADRIIVHGNDVGEILVKEVGIAAESIDVIPHIAIGQRELTPSEEPGNEVLFFGRIWPYKGLDYLIKAQPLISREFPEAKIVICGRGEDMQRYRSMIQDPDAFEIHDRWITDEERTEFFQRASVVVLPYIEASQSGVVPIAYANSKPVVATRVGGLPDAVEDGHTGFLVEPANNVELASAIVQLLIDRQLRRKMGEAGNRKLMQEYSPNAVCEQIATVYRQAISERGMGNES